MSWLRHLDRLNLGLRGRRQLRVVELVRGWPAPPRAGAIVLAAGQPDLLRLVIVLEADRKERHDLRYGGSGSTAEGQCLRHLAVLPKHAVAADLKAVKRQ